MESGKKITVDTKRSHTMIIKQNGYTMNVFKDGGGYRIIVTKPNGGKIFDFAFSQARAWEIARSHAGI
jgi:hypothetical protein